MRRVIRLSGFGGGGVQTAVPRLVDRGQRERVHRQDRERNSSSTSPQPRLGPAGPVSGPRGPRTWRGLIVTAVLFGLAVATVLFPRIVPGILVGAVVITASIHLAYRAMRVVREWWQNQRMIPRKEQSEDSIGD